MSYYYPTKARRSTTPPFEFKEEAKKYPYLFGRSSMSAWDLVDRPRSSRKGRMRRTYTGDVEPWGGRELQDDRSDSYSDWSRDGEMEAWGRDAGWIISDIALNSCQCIYCSTPVLWSGPDGVYTSVLPWTEAGRMPLQHECWPPEESYLDTYAEKSGRPHRSKWSGSFRDLAEDLRARAESSRAAVKALERENRKLSAKKESVPNEKVGEKRTVEDMMSGLSMSMKESRFGDVVGHIMSYNKLDAIHVHFH